VDQLRIASLVAVVSVIVACGGADDGLKRTQISQVNTVIEAVEARDREALSDLVQFTSLPCTDTGGAVDKPRCLGETAGTSIEVFQANECEAGWLRRDSVEPLLEQIVAMEPVVYAAFEAPEGFYMAGRYAVVFEGNDARVDEPGLKRYMAVGVEGDYGQITGVALGCGVDEPVHFLLPHQNAGFDDWLIEPE
jgi:hypothetical protein